MNIIKLLILFSVIWVCATLNAQTQQGYVKTLGRPDKKGEPLSGVSVRVKGEHNPVLSKEDGTLTLLLTGKKNGDAYALQEVKKKGYELNETGVIGRQYAYSDKVPLTIVMVSSAQLQADKQRIENNAFKVAEKNYKAKLDFLESQKADNAISEEHYRKELLELQDKFEKYQLLIDGLAEHYAHVDYDELNDKEREINICIENGELEHADSLIRTMFDPIDVLKRNKDALAQLNQKIAEANTIIDKANEDMAAVLKQQEKDANYLYQLYTIALSRFDNEKAGQYIKTRAELDTTNIKWQIDLAIFLSDYIGNYNDAIYIYRKALQYLYRNKDNIEEDLSLCYTYIGDCYVKMGNYSLAIDNYDKSLEVMNRAVENKLIYPQSNYFARIYSRIGLALNYKQMYSESLASLVKALEICKTTTSLDSIAFSEIYNNIGMVLKNMDNYQDALFYYKQSMDLVVNNNGAKPLFLASIYSNIGNAYYFSQDYPNAMEYQKKGLAILRQVLDSHHPKVADSYNDIGCTYKGMGNYPEALKYLMRALAIRKQIWGETHPSVAGSYHNIASVYYRQHDYSKAIDLYFKDLEISKVVSDIDSLHIASTLNNIGLIYSDNEDYNTALNFYDKALAINIMCKGHDNDDVASNYNNIGLVYIYQSKLEEALEYFFKSLRIKISLFGSEHPNVYKTYNNIALAYNEKEDFANALNYYQKALLILEKHFDEHHPDVGNICINIGFLYQELSEYEKALLYFKRAESVINDSSFPYVSQLFDAISACYRELGDSTKAAEYNKKSFFILSNKK